MEIRSQLIGASRAIREIEQEIENSARTDAKVLLTGESGVGKEVVAHLIHQGSQRRFSPFVPINCAGVPDSLLESELFGHMRGSFTDAHKDKKGWLFQAHGGTVFLDEVGEMSVRMQAVLLRFLETGEIQRVGAENTSSTANVRVISATNRSLLTQVADKNFRDDLYYRLNVIHISIPPLRERKEDVPALLNYFVRAASELHRVPMPCLLDDTVARLQSVLVAGQRQGAQERRRAAGDSSAIGSDSARRPAARDPSPLSPSNEQRRTVRQRPRSALCADGRGR